MKYDLWIYCPNKIKPYYKKASEEYLKRLSRYCKISVHYVSKEKEWEKRWASAEDKVLILPGPDSMPSEEFSRLLGEWEMRGTGRKDFFVSNVISASDSANIYTLHLSDFTMEPGLTGVILLEQIYRGYRIMHNHPYHK